MWVYASDKNKRKDEQESTEFTDSMCSSLIYFGESPQDSYSHENNVLRVPDLPSKLSFPHSALLSMIPEEI